MALFVVWMPTLFSVYPGLFNYDSANQFCMYLYHNITEHHPVLHTLIMGRVIYAGYLLTNSLQIGVFYYIIFQCIIFSVLISFIFLFFYDYKLPVWIHIFTFLFFTVFPTVVLHIVSITKDNFFSIFFIDFVLINFKLFNNTDTFFKGKKNIILWIIFALGTIIYRHNAYYIFVLYLPVLITFFIKNNNIKNRKKVVVMLLVFISIYLLYKYPFTKINTVAGIDNREKMSVPAQQIARVYLNHNDKLTEDEVEFVNKYFGYSSAWKTMYDPLLSDYTKGCLDIPFVEANNKYVTNYYFRLLCKYPKDYVDSFLENTYGFWYLWADRDGYIMVDSFEPVYIESKNVILYKYYKLYENSKIVSPDFIPSFIFSPALYLYIVMLFLWDAFCKKDTIRTGIYIYTILLWATFLLGPVALVRYVLFLFMMVPVEMGLLCIDSKH